MQVEHKTEKGTICFLKIEDDAFDIKLTESKLYEYDFVTFKTHHRWDNFKKRNWRWGTHLEVGKWQLIGITSDVKEDQAKTMVDDEFDWGFKTGYVDYTNSAAICGLSALYSFKSLMQHLQVHEVNPYSHFTNPEDFDDDAVEHAKELSKFVGKWLVLFKPNEK